MIILDTNVISQPMRPTPDPKVISWIDRQTVDDLYFTSVSLAELITGIERLPEGKRKQTLHSIADEMVDKLFEARILSFDALAARKFAEIYNRAVSNGYNIDFADCQIAAVAALHNFTIATGDEGPFRAAGLTTINPWLA